MLESPNVTLQDFCTVISQVPINFFKVLLVLSLCLVTRFALIGRTEVAYFIGCFIPLLKSTL